MIRRLPRSAGTAAFMALLLLQPLRVMAQERGLVTGNHAPPLTATDISGKNVSLQWPLEGKPLTALFFFDIRSADGIRGLTFFDRAYREAQDFGLNVIAVESSGADREELQAALDKYRSVYPHPPFPVVADSSRTIVGSFGYDALPQTLLIERHGVIVTVLKGFSEESRGIVTARLRSFLGLPDRVLAGADKDRAETGLAIDESSPRRVLFAGDSIEPFEVRDIAGLRHDFPWNAEGESMVIVYLWNDPCRPCIRGMLYLDQIYRQAVDTGLPLDVIAVEAEGLPEDTVRDIIDRLGKIYQPPSFPVVAGGASDLPDRLGWDTLPATYLIDGRGLLLSHSEGFDKALAGEWIGIIENQISRARGVLGRSIE